MKRIVAVLMIFTFVLSAFGCAKNEDLKENNESFNEVVDGTETNSDPATSEEFVQSDDNITENTSVDASKKNESSSVTFKDVIKNPSKKDFEELENMINNLDLYNINKGEDFKKLSTDKIYERYIFGSRVTLYWHFFGESYELRNTEKDPLNKFNSKNYRIMKYDGNNIDWLMKNVYGKEPDHNKSNKNWYYYKGYYYATLDSGWDAESAWIYQKNNKTSENCYCVELRDAGICVDFAYSDQYLYVDAIPGKVDGKTVWTLIAINSKTKKLSSNSNDWTGWEKAYISCMYNYLAEYEGVETPRYSLIYLNDDKIPELVIADGSSHMSGYKLYTYNGYGYLEVMSFGGCYGNFKYKEKTGTFVNSSTYQGNEENSVYNFDGKNCRLKWEGFTNEYGATEEFQRWESNNINVSKEQYYIDYNKYVPENLKETIDNNIKFDYDLLENLTF